MPLIKFVIETGEIDSENNIVIVDGVECKNHTPVSLNFDMDKIICLAKVIMEDGVIKAEADIDEKYFELYPAIGIEGIKEHINESGGITWDKTKLHHIGLCVAKNVDSRIKTIEKQIKEYAATTTDETK
jgi:hypothetical protein